MKKLIVISGPTATGKTSLSLEIANHYKEFDPVIINFDSLLFYKELNIGTAKPTEEERVGIPHRLIDIASIGSALTAHDYVSLAEKEIDICHDSGQLPILVGGSAFYLRALIKGMYNSTSSDPQLKNEIEEILENKGISFFINFLKDKDPLSLKQLHENDHYRIIRAYEHFKLTGKPISLEKQRLDELDPYDLSTGKNAQWNLHHIYLDLPKEEHWPYIQERTKLMDSLGLTQEVENLLAKGFTGDEKPLNSIGYKETQAYLRGEFKNREDYLDRISISTRQLAKSQRTFFKKIRPKNSYHPLADKKKIFQELEVFIREN